MAACDAAAYDPATMPLAENPAAVKSKQGPATRAPPTRRAVPMFPARELESVSSGSSLLQWGQRIFALFGGFGGFYNKGLFGSLPNCYNVA
eukprot:m.293351 g.293351  ORF g.293351 m.293351 type:complete len:91 (+) comp20682_c0_seq1:423-695(+)